MHIRLAHMLLSKRYPTAIPTPLISGLPEPQSAPHTSALQVLTRLKSSSVMFLKSAIYAGKSFRDDNALQYGPAMSTLPSDRLKEVLRSVAFAYKIRGLGSRSNASIPQLRISAPISPLNSRFGAWRTCIDATQTSVHLYVLFSNISGCPVLKAF
jgi:hypothetical protein